jgi:hypothetical protein
VTHYWPWWLGGAALAAIAIGYWLALGKLLGVSGSFAVALDPDTAPEPDGAALAAAMLAATREEFGDDAVADAAPPPSGASGLFAPTRLRWSAQVTLLIAIAVGGALGALSRGAWHLRADLGPDFARVVGSGWRGWLCLAAGGVLVGFGTQMAGGCTSGHGLCGTSRLRPGSLLATASFFGAAVAVSLLLSRIFS